MACRCSGQENLAKIFLGQLKAILPFKTSSLIRLGTLLGQYAEGIGGALDVTGISQGFGKRAGKIIKKYTTPIPKDIPALKNEISNILLKSNKRVIIIIDDIDRLESEEVHQLFTVIKVLADFPNVIYLLAFDQNIMAKSLDKYNSIPGDKYLEKIIQVPFFVPHIDRTRLQNSLFSRLDEIINKYFIANFDKGRWASIFNNGIDIFFKNPRNILRFCNSFSFTYPQVHNEVNIVDFTAIEAIRIFVPELYSYIAENPKIFIEHNLSSEDSLKLLEKILQQKVPDLLHDNIKNVLVRLFPKLRKNSTFIKDERRLLHISSKESFSYYFSPFIDKNVNNTIMLRWINDSHNQELFSSTLINAKNKKITLQHELLDRLYDYINDIPKDNISIVIKSLLNIGDDCIESIEEAPIFYIYNSQLINRSIISMLHLYPDIDAFDMLKDSIQNGNALMIQGWLLLDMEERIKKDESIPIEVTDYWESIKIWINKINCYKDSNKLISHIKLASLLYLWYKWIDDKEIVRLWCSEITSTDENMLIFIKSFMSVYSEYFNDKTAIKYYINPKKMEDFIKIEDLEQRILELKSQNNIPHEYDQVAKSYLDGMKKIHEGKDPSQIEPTYE